MPFFHHKSSDTTDPAALVLYFERTRLQKKKFYGIQITAEHGVCSYYEMDVIRLEFLITSCQ
jgi:hypothetical protein